MFKRFAIALVLLTPAPLFGQGSPYSPTIIGPITVTGTGTTGAYSMSGKVGATGSTATSFSSCTITFYGLNLTTATFGFLGSSDSGLSYFPVPISALLTPGTTATTMTATTAGLYQWPCGGFNYFKIITSGTFTASQVFFTITENPIAQASNGSSGGGGGGSPTGAATGALGGTYPAPTLNREINPILQFSASGTFATTTGTITSGSHSLTLADATGWVAGMGIAVHNAGAGGAVELITTVTNVAGNVLTLTAAASANATTQTVNHDDGAALANSMTASMTSGVPVHLTVGNYNDAATTLVASSPMTMYGDGVALSKIINRSTTQDVLDITYNSALAATTGAFFQDFSILQDSSVTPTAGNAILVQAPSGWLTALNIARVNIFGTYTGLYIGNFQITNWFHDIRIWNTLNAGIHYNSLSPGGDDHVDGVEMAANNGTTTTGLIIDTADFTRFNHLKINSGSGITFTGNNTTTHVIFDSISIEGTGSLPLCGVNFLASATSETGIQFDGGEIALLPTSFCSTSNAPGLAYQLLDLSTNNPTPGQVTFGFINKNFQASNEAGGIVGQFGQISTSGGKVLLIENDPTNNTFSLQGLHQGVGFTDQTILLNPSGGKVGTGPGGFANGIVGVPVACSTSGNAYFTQADIGATHKGVRIALISCVGTASWTFPVAFNAGLNPQVLSQTLAAKVTSISPTAVTVTGTNDTGYIDIDGF